MAERKNKKRPPMWWGWARRPREKLGCLPGNRQTSTFEASPRGKAYSLSGIRVAVHGWNRCCRPGSTYAYWATVSIFTRFSTFAADYMMSSSGCHPKPSEVIQWSTSRRSRRHRTNPDVALVSLGKWLGDHDRPIASIMCRTH